MAIRFGYAAIALGPGLSTNHSTILRTATPERLSEAIAQNLRELQAILEYNRRHNIRMFRIGSSIIPFGSHAVNRLPWWDLFRDEFEAIGQFAKREGMRLSMHPGQYTVLNSITPNVVRNAMLELMYSSRVLDTLGLDDSHKVVLHVGSSVGGKEEAMARFVASAEALPASTRARIVIENDERTFTAEEVLALSRRTGFPAVFDNLHDRLNRSSRPLGELLPEIFGTWGATTPKVHFSSQAPGGRPGAHADYADPDEFRAFLDMLRPFGDLDIMLEAKAKDLSLLDLGARMPELGIVVNA